MGSIGYYTSLPTRAALREYMDTTWNPERARNVEVSIQSTGEGRHGGWSTIGYAAVERCTGEVFAAVWLADKRNGEFCVKTLDETVGPVLFGVVPKRILNALTPTENQYALEWRAEAWKAREAAAEAAKTAKQAIGKTIEFAHSLNYGDPVGEITRVYVADRNLFTDPTSGRRLRPPRNWAKSDFTVVN